MIPLPSLTGGRSREHSRLAKAFVENIIIIIVAALPVVVADKRADILPVPSGAGLFASYSGGLAGK